MSECERACVRVRVRECQRAYMLAIVCTCIIFCILIMRVQSDKMSGTNQSYHKYDWALLLYQYWYCTNVPEWVSHK